MTGIIFNHCLHSWSFVHALAFLHVILLCLKCRWRPKTHSFHLPFEEMTITLQDCQKMLGLRIHGNAVTGQCRSEGWRARVEAFLGHKVGEQGARTSGVLISWLRQEFTQCPDEADEETVGYYCRLRSYTYLPAFSSPTPWVTLCHGCESTALVIGTRRVSTAGAL